MNETIMAVATNQPNTEIIANETAPKGRPLVDSSLAQLDSLSTTAKVSLPGLNNMDTSTVLPGHDRSVSSQNITKTTIDGKTEVSIAVIDQLKKQGQADSIHNVTKKHSSPTSDVATALLTTEHANVEPIALTLPPKNYTAFVSWKGDYRVTDFVRSTWRGNPLCIKKNPKQKGPSMVLLKISFNSRSIFDSSLGTGNFVQAFYSARLAARSMGNVDLQIECKDAQSEAANLILPWVAGFFPSVQGKSAKRCDRRDKVRSSNYDHLLPAIQYELRRMAVALVGIPDKPNHPSIEFAAQYLQPNSTTFPGSNMQLPLPKIGQKPLFPNTTLDDVSK
jgi:hypothetical protein